MLLPGNAEGEGGRNKQGERLGTFLAACPSEQGAQRGCNGDREQKASAFAVILTCLSSLKELWPQAGIGGDRQDSKWRGGDLKVSPQGRWEQICHPPQFIFYTHAHKGQGDRTGRERCTVRG